MAHQFHVMISSTALDLPIHRQQVREACLMQNMFPLMMEHLPASDADAIEVSLSLVDQADVYLGVIAHRYGYVPKEGNPAQLSITEMEYNRAVERGIPRLIFLMDKAHPISIDEVEMGEGAIKLNTFKDKLKPTRVVKFFKSPDDLRGQIIHSLSKLNINPNWTRPKYLNAFAHYDLANLVGRESQLSAMIAHFQKRNLLLLHGIGGIGKTTLAKAYVSQVQESFDHIAYVEVVSSIAESMLIQIGSSPDVGFQVDAKLDLEEKFKVLIDTLRYIPNLLLILDNVNEANDLKIRKKQLASLQAKILLTGRARPLVFVQEHLVQEIQALTAEEAFCLFSNFYSIPLSNSEQPLVTQLLKDAFHHPKLVEVIAKVAQADYSLSLQDLSQIVRNRRFSDEGANYPVEIDEETKPIYNILYDLFDPKRLSEGAKQLLLYFASIPSIEIPVQDLADLLEIESATDRKALIDGLNELVQAGWIENVNNRSFSMHGLVQWVIHERLNPTVTDFAPLVNGMRKMLSDKPNENLLVKQRYLQYTTEWLSLFADETDDEQILTFLWIALTYGFLGDHRQALTYNQKVLAIREAVLPADHPDLAITFGSLAETYGALGDYQQRLAYHMKALAIQEAVLPVNHPDLARSFSNLAATYGDLGDHRQALAYNQKALAIREAVLPVNHPDLALSFNNLAETYGALGDYKQRLAYNQKAQAIREAVLPADHPDLAITFSNLAATYGALGDYQQRLAYHMKALAIREAVLPVNHPDLARSFNNLAATYGDLGDYRQALAYNQKALAIREVVLSANHPDLAITFSNLAVTYGVMGDYQQALAYNQKALAIREAVLPTDHPHLAITYNNIAEIYFYMNNLEQALVNMRKAMIIRATILPTNHPDLALSQKSLFRIEQALQGLKNNADQH